MIRLTAFVAAALLAYGSTALAKGSKSYSIQSNNYCDHLDITVAANVAVGSSDATSCDDAYVVGTADKTKAAPGGAVITLGTDLGASPLAVEEVDNLKAGTAGIYLTSDGTSVTAIDDTITVTKGKHARSGKKLPSYRSALRR